MEIEAKWTVGSKQAFEKLIAAFPDGSRQYGYEVNVRWGGRPRKFVDYYYDTKDSTLGRAMHVLRHRVQYSSPLDPSHRTDPSELQAATWSPNWTRLQYKSTPCRIGAIWFRHEVGACKLWDEEGEDLCPDLSSTITSPESDLKPILDGQESHVSIEALRSDHPEINAQLERHIQVVDYRYRVELSRGSAVELELSLDQLTIDSADVDYQAELEILAKPTGTVIDDLRRLVSTLESNRSFELSPAITNKSGAVDSAEVPICR